MYNNIYKHNSLGPNLSETSSRRPQLACLLTLACLLAPVQSALAAIPAE